MNSMTPLEKYLIRDGLIDPLVADQLVERAQQDNLFLITYLVKNNILNSDVIAKSCSDHFGLSIVDLDHYPIEYVDYFGLDIELILQHRIIPLKKENNILYVGMSDPTNRHALDAIIFHTGFIVHPVIVLEDKLIQFMDTHFAKKILSLPKELFLEENKMHVQENTVNYDEPIIRFVDNLIHHAIEQSASDIHIEPFQTTCQIRHRKDGVLYKMTDIPIQLASRLVTRLKVMAKLDITERRLPQDGRFHLHELDIRINSCPTLFGEKIVLRLLHIPKKFLNIDELGFTSEQKNIFINKITQPQGLILVTGPTGSGKTITLYSALSLLNNPEKNILTIEDPVEIQLNGVNQVNINPKMGLHFSNTLRTFLRQDPDIIMVGEIRDHETAEIAIQAAHTGHLVLSTLHTNSALETLIRLQAMGVAPYNIVSSISLIIAQRLVRKLCGHCKLPDTHSSFSSYRASHCKHCLKGYQGRIGIYEFLPITEKISQLILLKKSASLLKQASLEGFKSLREIALEKVAQGITSLTEINRVIQQ